jgi:hypothetical protein
MRIAEVLQAYVASSEQEEADRCAMLRLLPELAQPTSREQPRAHFTASSRT